MVKFEAAPFEPLFKQNVRLTSGLKKRSEIMYVKFQANLTPCLDIHTNLPHSLLKMQY